MKKGFDNDLYVKLQSEKILERIGKFDNKLYLSIVYKNYTSWAYIVIKLFIGHGKFVRCSYKFRVGAYYALLALGKSGDASFEVAGADFRSLCI